MSQTVYLIGLFSGLGAILLASIITLVVAVAVRKEAHRISGVLDESYSWLKTQLERTQRDLSKAQEKTNSWKRRAQKS
jgi:hypothetical protein